MGVVENAIEANGEPVCSVHRNCLLTAGFYIGGGMYVCWGAALRMPARLFSNQQLIALKGDPYAEKHRA